MGWFHPLISQQSDYSGPSGGQNHEAHLEQVDTPDFRRRGSTVGHSSCEALQQCLPWEGGRGMP